MPITRTLKLIVSAEKRYDRDESSLCIRLMNKLFLYGSMNASNNKYNKCSYNTNPSGKNILNATSHLRV